MNFEPVAAGAVINADPMADLLGHAGFTGRQIVTIRADGFDQLEDMTLDVLEEQDIKDLAKSLASLAAAGGRVTFGIARTKRLIGMMHWVQDHGRVSLTPTVVTGVTQEAMRQAWSEALERANARKAVAKQCKATQAGAEPQELKSDKGFHEWEDRWDNYLSTIPGQNGVPLSYVTRLENAPEYTPDPAYTNFVDRSIGCAPHSGAAYINDRRKVHQLLISHLSSSMQQWIEPVVKQQDGRLSMETLRTHCVGSGNVSRRVSHAEKIKRSLVYTDERRGTFNSFLQKLSKMYLIFKEENEPMAEDAKVRVLFEKINHPGLKDVIAALEVQRDISQMSYEQITNHLVTKVSKFDDVSSGKFRGRNLSSATTRHTDKAKVPATGGVHMPDGSIWTGFYPNWKQMQESMQAKVIAAREKKKSSRKKDTKVSELKTLISEVASIKRSIAKTATSTVTLENEGSDTPNNAGTQFGGRNKKQKSADE